MPAVVVDFWRWRRLPPALLPRHPEDESERNRRKHRPRDLRGSSGARQASFGARGEHGPEGGAKNEQLRHDDAGDADEKKGRRKHGGNLTRLASPVRR